MKDISKLEQHLDHLWKSVNSLAYEARIDFSKTDSIPELDLDGKDYAKVDVGKRSMIFKRIKFFKTSQAYNQCLEAIEALGFKALRTDGRHAIAKDV